MGDLLEIAMINGKKVNHPARLLNPVVLENQKSTRQNLRGINGPGQKKDPRPLSYKFTERIPSSRTRFQLDLNSDTTRIRGSRHRHPPLQYTVSPQGLRNARWWLCYRHTACVFKRKTFWSNADSVYPLSIFTIVMLPSPYCWSNYTNLGSIFPPGNSTTC